MTDYSYESRHENGGLYLEADCWFWEESLDYDPTSPRNLAIEAKIAADDRAFLEACGIKAL